MNNKITQFLAFALLLSAILAVTNSFDAGVSYAQIDPLDDFTRSVEGGGDFKTGLQKFEGSPHELSSIGPGADVITTAIFKIIDYAKYLVGALAVLFTTIAGVKLIVAGKKIDEVSEKTRNTVEYMIFGFILIMIADYIVQKVVFGEYGECIASESNAAECAAQGSLQFRGIANFLSYFIGSVAVLVIVVSGFRLATSTGDEEVVKKQKSRIALAIAGLVAVAVSSFVVDRIFFPDAGTKPIDVEAGLQLTAQLVNFAASFITTLSILALIYGGYLYVVSFGNEDGVGKAKKIIVGAIAGVLIALAAFGFVRTVIQVEGREDNAADFTTEFELPAPTVPIP